MNNLALLNNKLKTLAVFRNITDTPVIKSLSRFVNVCSGNGPNKLSNQLEAYGALCNSLYAAGGDMSKFVSDFIRFDENFYLFSKIKSQPVINAIEKTVLNELDTLQELSRLSSRDVSTLIDYSDFLPSWENTYIDIKTEYLQMLDQICHLGYGIFAKYRSFKMRDGRLVPISKPDNKTIHQLYGYQRERNLVLENTKALVEGRPASNVLLYGDAGTGKSSTIKACAYAMADQGVRLIEFNKSQFPLIPDLIDLLCDSPLKFIFYIDDLTFNANDDSFASLKGILEGNATGDSRNIVIYATSNRRHLVREDSESRMGTDLHLNDTLQETMSLSARFGLTITFSKPEKDLYLEIVSKLADEYGVKENENNLLSKAEAFAIRANGRSPRTAKQFIEQVLIGIR